MDADVRNKEEEIIKNKVGIENLNFEKVSDEDIEKVVTKEDKAEAIKRDSGAEDLNIENLPDDQVDALLKNLKNKESSSSSLSESRSMINSIDEIIDCMSAVQSTEEDIVEALKVNAGLKIEEAQKICNSRLTEKESFIEKEYEKLKESIIGIAVAENDERDEVKKSKPSEVKIPQEVDHIEDLKNIKGKEKEEKLDIPEVEYANKKEAKTIPDPIGISE